MIKERREYRRKHLFEFFKVIDRNSNDIIGNLTDISVKGISVLNKGQINDGNLISLKVLLPEHLKYHEIECEAKSVWCREDVNEQCCRTGFEFVSISEDDLRKIKEVF